jgi:hypothetical protein
MKPLHVLQASLFLVAIAPAAFAQTAPPPSPIARWDVTGTLGWFNADKSDATRESYNEWYNSSLYGGIGAGWYWTDNHKTEIDFAGTTGGDIYTTTPVVIGNQQTFTTSRFFFSTRRLTLGQQYQAYRNAWFHPHVAAGIDLTWEKSREERSPTILFDSPSRTTRELLPAQTIGPDVELIVRPYAAVGFKAYMSQRAFFRSDLRFTFRDGIDEALWRVGFGVDF